MKKRKSRRADPAMSLRSLLIEVRLLNGRYHGVSEWPPAPFRLFQALVAGAYGGRWRTEPEDEKDAAFRWLEALAPPHIGVPAKMDLRATTYYVPNNDIDAVDADPRRVPEIRSGKLMRAMLITSEEPLVYAWPFDTGEEHARRLCILADRLHTLGHGVDAAFARADVADWSTAEARLARDGSRSSVARPGRIGDPDTDLLCPVPGSLISLKKRHAAGVKRFERRRDGRATVTLFTQPPKSLARAVTYKRPPSLLLFELRAPDDAALFSPFAQEEACNVATAVRDLAARRLTEMLPQRAAEIERLVVGRAAGVSEMPRRVRIVPLPSIGHTHASPSIRRVLVEIPSDCPFSRDEFSLALAGQSLERIERATGEINEEAVLLPAGDMIMLRHYGIDDREPARRWHSITPVAVPERRPAGKLRGSGKIAADQRTCAAVADALRHAGHDWRGSEIRVQVEPFRRRGARADAFEAGRFARRLRHVEIVFPMPVTGPLVIGDGRWLGLGLMAPARDEPPSVHIFAIDPADALPLVSRQALTRALRRAVMARVDDEWRKDRGRRNEPLPTFFTGHEPDGASARSGRHEHLFFIADDSNGDGWIDRLAIVAPHLADRSVSYNSDRGSTTRGNLQLLDRALAGLTVLRAGSVGVPRVSMMPEPRDGDPLFGRAARWVSETPYRPTHHPKRDGIAEGVAADLVTECTRRGFPRPAVDILDIAQGPRGGLVIRARLRFSTAVRGPVILGRDSHFGAGMFAAEA
jgi:CRISPR-associated protein Csb2